LSCQVYWLSTPLMNTITGCVPYLTRYPMAMQGVSVNLKVPVKMLFIVWNQQVLNFTGSIIVSTTCWLILLQFFVQVHSQ
jgi:hypothetical protein